MSRPLTQDNLSKKVRNLEREVYDPEINFLKIPFPFASGWANSGGSYEDASYSKIGSLVVLQGIVTKTGGTPAPGNVIGTLPEGYRPFEILQFPVKTGVADAYGTLEIQADGDVVWIGGATGETDNTSLSGICYVV
jgi:hypothetical protein